MADRDHPLMGTVVYDSADFIVVAYGSEGVGEAFEVVRKAGDPGQVVFLFGAMAAPLIFQRKYWLANTPTQEEVEQFLDRVTQLGLQPLVIH